MCKRILLTVLMLFCLAAVSAQQKKIYFEADLLEYDEDLRDGAEQYTGHVVFRHGNTVGYCDTALHFRDRNQLHAFGHRVRIIVNDSVTLFGDFLIYDGNARTVSISRNVILKDKTAALYTDSLIYDLNDDLGYYLTGGRMVSDSNTLTSRIGYYNTKTNMADLYDSVHLVNETYIGDSRSASYNTSSEIVYFTARTHLYSAENDFYTDLGWYDTKGKQLLLDGNAELHNEGQSLYGDSLFYDDNISFGQGWQNVCLIDTVKNYIVQGNYMEFMDKNYALVTDSMLLILIDNGDSLYLHSDTLHVLFDTAQSPKSFFVYNKVKFYRDDMQGACDSMVYHVEDSTITMYYNPVVWSDANQLTGDTIRFNILDSVNMSMELCRSAFIVSSVYDDETEFNQIKGLNIVGIIYDKHLTRVDVIGNAESLYYILEEDSSLVGINSAATSEMRILFEDNEIQSIVFYNDPDGKLYPDAELHAKDRQLKDFRWLNAYRPATRHDIFTMPVERVSTQPANDEDAPGNDEKPENP
ncbi:MAG: hypothetical protein J6Y35_02640 [Bacteroidales bacterium]|nr:hypothetical protein [Bacteroidales bacterium]